MTTYTERINQWRSERDAGLRVENGWLALAGLFWLKPGENLVGSDPACHVVLPAGAPARLGSFTLKEKAVSLKTDDDVLIDGSPARQGALQPDTSERPSTVTLGALRMVAIERSGRFAIRLWDNDRPERRTFPPRTWFPIDESFCITGRYAPYAVPKSVLVPDVFGNMREGTMNGAVTFALRSQIFRLEASREDDELFIMFRDQTAGHGTYTSGRYLSAPLRRNNDVELDFNLAYNPPCAFTDYATCAFAPKENHLKLRIEAGETFSGH